MKIFELVAVIVLIASLILFNWGCNASDPPQSSNSPVLDFQPNILWLVAEDLSPYIPSFGDSTITTPTLSRLAAEGVRYTRVFSPSGVCAPSRAAIATGMYPSGIGANHMRTGPWYTTKISKEALENSRKHMPPNTFPYEAVPPSEVVMHSEHLRRAGYYTSNNSKEDYQFRKSLTAWDESGPKAHWRNRKPGQPFFAIFNFGVTHESRIWAKSADSLWVDENLDVTVPPYLPDTPVGRKDIRRMYSNIKEMDAQIGRVLAELESDGLLDSTIIFWYSDHGGPLPRQKRLLYDSGLQVPMIVRFPGQWQAGQVDSQLVSFIDFKSTILSLAGLQPPDYLDGRAFLGRYAAASDRQYIHGAADRFDECYDNIRAVRDHRFKYLRNYQYNQSYYLPLSYREQMPIMQELLRLRDSGKLTDAQALWFRTQKPPEELYDTVTDPHELHNLASEPAYQKKLLELRQECDRWLKEIGDQPLLPEAQLIEQFWPSGKQPVTDAPTLLWEARTLTLSANAGAAIGYQILADGAASLTDHWKVYTGPFDIPEGKTVSIVAHRLGYQPSDTLFIPVH